MCGNSNALFRPLNSYLPKKSSRRECSPGMILSALVLILVLVLTLVLILIFALLILVSVLVTHISDLPRKSAA